MVTPLVLRGGWKLSAETDSAGDVMIGSTGRIAPTIEEGSRTLDVEGSVVLPGMVNLHDHLRSLLPSGRKSESLALTQVIANGTKAAEVARPSHYRDLTALGSALQILTGITSVIDHIYPLHSPGMLEAAMEGHKRVGIRAALAVGMMDLGPAAVTSDPERIVEVISGVADTVIPSERLFLAPVSLRQSSIDTYSVAVETAEKTGIRLYTHIAESEEEVERCQVEHGVRPVELLGRLGFLRPGTVIVHGVHLNDRELDLLADSGTALAYCPTNHLRFAKGFAPVAELRRRDVSVGLGIDGAVDMFSEMRGAVYAQASAQRQTGALSSEDVFAMATDRSGVFDTPGETATLEPGSRADLVVVDLSRPGLQPVDDPLWTLVHRATGTDIQHVFVEGRSVVREGALASADIDELVERALEAMREVASLAGLDERGDRRFFAQPRQSGARSGPPKHEEVST